MRIRKQEAVMLPKIIVLLGVVMFVITFFGATMYYLQRTPTAAEGFGLIMASALVSLLHI